MKHPPLRRIERLKLYFVPINKNGSTAISRTLYHVGYPMGGRERHHAAQEPDWPKVVMWRDPKARLESFYRMQLPTTPQGHLYEPFSDWFGRHSDEELRWDPHTGTQADFCKYDGVWLENVEIIYWDFEALAKRLGVEKIPPMNVSRPFLCDWTQETTDKFNRIYAEDIEIWQRR